MKCSWVLPTHSTVNNWGDVHWCRRLGAFRSRTSVLTRALRQWHPTPVLLPGKSHGWRSLEGCSPWHRWGSDTTERLHFHFSLSCTGEGNGNPLQCSCLENPRDGGAWWAAVYGVTQSRTWLKWLSIALAWKIPRTEEPVKLQSMGSRRNGHDWETSFFPFHFHSLEKEMATHSSVLAWRIPGTAAPGGLPSMGSHRTRLKRLSSSSSSALMNPRYIHMAKCGFNVGHIH